MMMHGLAKFKLLEMAIVVSPSAFSHTYIFLKFNMEDFH
jgi:hypothetical protein